MLKILTTLIIFLALAFFFGATERSFARRKDGTFVGLGTGLAIAVTYSVIVAACHYGIYSLKVSRPNGWVAWCGVLGLICLLGLVFLVYRFADKKANWWKEFLGFSIVALVTFCVAGSGMAVLSTISDGIGGRFLNWLPIIFIIAVEALMAYQVLKYKEHDDVANILLIAALILAVIVSLIILPSWKKTETVVDPSNEEIIETETTVEEVVEETEEEPQPEERLVGFYNLSLLNDDIEDNDFNFGWNPYDEEKTVEDYDKDFRNRLEVDPAFAAANMAWADYWLGTRYIGVFYDECNGAWDAAINAAKDAFIADDELYKATVKSFEEYLDTAELELRYAKSGITDQMYMNPYTVTGIPDIIVLKTNNHDGHFLVYIFHPKGEKKEVGYRIECGYQPTDVEKTLKITPSTTPKKPTNPPTTPPPTPSNDPGKDPSKGTQGEVVKPNDDKGPGPNTNNGDGSQHSSAEEKPNSTQGTNQDYNEKVQELKETNEGQKVGGDSNTPSTPAPAPDASQGQKETNVINPGNQGNGNGYGGADTPTPIKPVALDQNGQPVSNPDNPNGAWGGPTD